MYAVHRNITFSKQKSGNKLITDYTDSMYDTGFQRTKKAMVVRRFKNNIIKKSA
jgi:hypothetical protein